MTKYKVFVDGQEGTTGLEINERLQKRSDIEILTIAGEKRKDIEERRSFINQAEIVFLCLPDDAARESVSLVSNPETRVIDCSTAHRTDEGWAYGIPELGAEYRKAVETSKRVANPGCFATGFNMLLRPLVKEGIVPADYPVSCHAVSGYSGGGKKLIGVYESSEGGEKFRSPCFYSLRLQHKHLPEMRKHSGLSADPVFTPIVGNFYRGMTVAVPLHAGLFAKKTDAREISALYRDYYAGQRFVKAAPAGFEETLELGYLGAESCNFTNNIELLSFGNGKEILVAARLDNLGKGASGAAVQNMNIMLGLDETSGLAQTA